APRPATPGGRAPPRTRVARARARSRSTPRCPGPARSRDPAGRRRSAGRTRGTSTSSCSRHHAARAPRTSSCRPPL
ncbi:MAG: hypothetical protein AVDCRST_MAG20-219, partial [uncultured Acidimicrobiales bacterium]